MRKLVRNDFTVRCTPEQAFDYMSDMRNELEWNAHQCKSVEKVTDGPVGKGTKFRAKWKDSPYIEVDYLEFDRPHSWRAHSSGSMESNFHGMVEPHPDGARVVTDLELVPHGFFKLIFPIFKLAFARAERASAASLRKSLNELHGNPRAHT